MPQNTSGVHRKLTNDLRAIRQEPLGVSCNNDDRQPRLVSQDVSVMMVDAQRSYANRVAL